MVDGCFVLAPEPCPYSQQVFGPYVNGSETEFCPIGDENVLPQTSAA